MAAKFACSLGALLLAGIATGATTPASLPPALKTLATSPTVHRISSVDNNRSCDIGTYPAATLLLPYFEVEVAKPVDQAANTIFTIVNTSKLPQIARITIWTDYGYPAMWFNAYLTGYDAESFSMYDILATGQAPRTSAQSPVGSRSVAANSSLTVTGCDSLGGDLPSDVMAEVRAMLTSGKAASVNGCKVGGEHAMALGYVTVDVVNGCSSVSPLDSAYYSQVLLFDNVLTGDYDRLNPDRNIGNHAGGNPLVHIRAVPEGGKAGPLPSGTPSLPYTFYDRFTPSSARHIDRRQPLPSSFAARYIEGGTASFSTDYAIWREGMDRVTALGGGCSLAASAAMPYASIVRFDEMENPTVAAAPKGPGSRTLTFPVTSAPSAAAAPFPPQAGYTLSGWIYLNLDNTAGLYASTLSPYSTARPSQNWVIIHMRADGRYAVDFDATTISNGCVVVETEYK